MTASVSSLFHPAWTALDLHAATGADAICEVIQLLGSNPDVLDLDQFYLAVKAREEINSTALVNGVALPHARTDFVRNIVLAVGRSRKGVWFERSQQTVHLIFLIGTPRDAVREYLEVVAGLARALKDPARREGLMTASTSEEFLALLTLPE